MAIAATVVIVDMALLYSTAITTIPMGTAGCFKIQLVGQATKYVLFNTRNGGAQGDSTACPIALLKHLPQVRDSAVPAGTSPGCPQTQDIGQARDCPVSADS